MLQIHSLLLKYKGVAAAVFLLLGLAVVPVKSHAMSADFSVGNYNDGSYTPVIRNNGYTAYNGYGWNSNGSWSSNWNGGDNATQSSYQDDHWRHMPYKANLMSYNATYGANYHHDDWDRRDMNNYNAYRSSYNGTMNNWSNGGYYGYTGYNRSNQYLSYEDRNNPTVYYNNYAGTPGYEPLVHGQPPQVQSGQAMLNLQTGQTTGVAIHPQSVFPGTLTTTLCAEERYPNGTMVNQGCIPQITFTDASQGVSTQEIHAWPSPTGVGTRNLIFTYRSYDGWHELLTPNHSQQDVFVSSG